MKSLLSKGLTGITALLLAAAAIALLLFAFATLLGIAAVLGLVAAGVFIGAPSDAKALVREVLAAVPKWLDRFQGIVADAGELFLATLGRGRGGAAQEDAPSAASEDSGASGAPESPAGDARNVPAPEANRSQPN